MVRNAQQNRVRSVQQQLRNHLSQNKEINPRDYHAGHSLGGIAAGGVRGQSHRWDVFPDLAKCILFSCQVFENKVCSNCGSVFLPPGSECCDYSCHCRLLLEESEQALLFFFSLLQGVQEKQQRRRIYLHFRRKWVQICYEPA